MSQARATSEADAPISSRRTAASLTACLNLGLVEEICGSPVRQLPFELEFALSGKRYPSVRFYPRTHDMTRAGVRKDGRPIRPQLSHGACEEIDKIRLRLKTLEEGDYEFVPVLTIR
jgi:hypothetical protein